MGKPALSFARKQKLRSLAALMNKQNDMPVPVIRPLLDIMDLVMDERETEFLLRVGEELHTTDELLEISGLSNKEFRPFFAEILKKGLLLERLGEPVRYLLTPILVGWMELQLCRGGEGDREKEFARRFGAMIGALGKGAFWPVRNVQNLFFRYGTVPYQSIAPAASPTGRGGKPIIRVDRQVEHSGFSVLPSQDAHELVDRFGEKGQIALMHCFCRHWRKLEQDPCRFGVEAQSCLVLGELAHHVVKEDFGRAVTRDEALAVLEQARDAGVVHTVFHERDNTDMPQAAICNCCWDCCGVLGSYNRGLLPLHFKCYYEARVEKPDACTGCGECEWHCPTAAVMVVNGHAAVRVEKCIGCGQCAHQCANDVLALTYHARDVFLPILKKSKARLG